MKNEKKGEKKEKNISVAQEACQESSDEGHKSFCLHSTRPLRCLWCDINHLFMVWRTAALNTPNLLGLKPTTSSESNNKYLKWGHGSYSRCNTALFIESQSFCCWKTLSLTSAVQTHLWPPSLHHQALHACPCEKTEASEVDTYF